MNAGTDYVLLVWAYNGYYGKLYSVQQTTAGKPDPLQIHYTYDDVENGLTKAGYCGTWDYYAVDAYDKTGNTSRQYFGQVVVEDGGTTSGYADFDNVFSDYVKVSGLTGAPQAFNAGESQYMAWSGGLLYVLAPQLIGNVTLQGTDYFVNVAYTAEGDDGVYSGRGLLLGAPGGRRTGGFRAQSPASGVEQSDVHGHVVRNLCGLRSCDEQILRRRRRHRLP